MFINHSTLTNMRILHVSDADSSINYPTVNECKLIQRSVDNRFSSLEHDIMENKRVNSKLSKIIIGNGGVGLVEKVNLLYHRNQLLYHFFGVIQSISVSLIILYLTGVLKL